MGRVGKDAEEGAGLAKSTAAKDVREQEKETCHFVH